MAKRVYLLGAFFLNSGPGADTSGTFGDWGRLSTTRRKRHTVVTLHSRPLGNPNPKHRFSSTNQPPRP